MRDTGKIARDSHVTRKCFLRFCRQSREYLSWQQQDKTRLIVEGRLRDASRSRRRILIREGIFYNIRRRGACIFLSTKISCHSAMALLDTRRSYISRSWHTRVGHAENSNSCHVPPLHIQSNECELKLKSMGFLRFPLEILRVSTLSGNYYKHETVMW